MRVNVQNKNLLGDCRKSDFGNLKAVSVILFLKNIISPKTGTIFGITSSPGSCYGEHQENHFHTRLGNIITLRIPKLGTCTLSVAQTRLYRFLVQLSHRRQAIPALTILTHVQKTNELSSDPLD